MIERLPANGPIYQCAVNFSEGRDPAVISALAAACGAVHGARLIDYSADADHHRSVFTVLGSGDAVRSALRAAARVAVRQIDMRRHTGIHPRIGAIDVAPIVPLWGATRQGAVETAEELAADLAGELGLPIYLYEWSARVGRISALPLLRRGGFEGIASTELTGSRAPDYGPARAHPSAGVTVVGARAPLSAYNVVLNSDDARAARAIAHRIRAEREHRADLAGVRALGLYLASRNRAQVSLNLTQPSATSIPAVFNYVMQEAERLGVLGAESEVIGAIPLSALANASPSAIQWNDFRPEQILDNWLPLG